MDIKDYILAIEAAVNRPDDLAALRRKVMADTDLAPDDQVDALGRIERYESTAPRDK